MTTTEKKGREGMEQHEMQAIMDAWVGKCVLIQGNHPWSGRRGTVDRWEKTPWGMRPVVQLDCGESCFVMDFNDMKDVTRASTPSRPKARNRS